MRILINVRSNWMEARKFKQFSTKIFGLDATTQRTKCSSTHRCVCRRHWSTIHTQYVSNTQTLWIICFGWLPSTTGRHHHHRHANSFMAASCAFAIHRIVIIIMNMQRVRNYVSPSWRYMYKNVCRTNQRHSLRTAPPPPSSSSSSPSITITNNCVAAYISNHTTATKLKHQLSEMKFWKNEKFSSHAHCEARQR